MPFPLLLLLPNPSSMPKICELSALFRCLFLCLFLFSFSALFRSVGSTILEFSPLHKLLACDSIASDFTKSRCDSLYIGFDFRRGFLRSSSKEDVRVSQLSYPSSSGSRISRTSSRCCSRNTSPLGKAGWRNTSPSRQKVIKTKPCGLDEETLATFSKAVHLDVQMGNLFLLSKGLN